MKVIPSSIECDYKRIEVEQADYERLGTRPLANMAFQIFLIREFENTLLALWDAGCVHGPVHTSIGEEACAAGAMTALAPSDKIASTHRAHHHYLAKLVVFFAADGFDAAADAVPGAMAEQVTILMGEIMGLSIGCCGGRGGSMHLRNERIGVFGTNAIVAGGVPAATGAAFASKYNADGDVIVCFLGDGAVNQGSFHEALNLAGLWKLPIVYFIENNHYAVATSIERATAIEELAARAASYGIAGRIVDGMDPVAVAVATEEALAHARDGKGAVVVEAKCYRFPHHAGPNPGSSYGYRTKEEERQWRDRDPHAAFPRKLVSDGFISEDRLERMRQKAVETVRNALDGCVRREDGAYAVREELWPKPETLTADLRSDGSEFSGVTFSERGDFSEFESLTYVQSIAAVTGRHLEKDARVFVLGEEVANFEGGPYGATGGLPGKHPDRVLNAPISECGFTGLACGAAMSGLRPIVEIMFPDFALVAADQLFNQIGKLRHIYGGTVDVPLVVRTRIAIGCGYGAQHSMDPTGLFNLFSGWTIVAPSNGFDYIGLFNSAMRSADPVLVMEHHTLYAQECDVPRGDLDYFVRIGKAKVVREGADVTVLCYSSMVDLCMRAAGELAAEGISTEVIDLRTLSRADIDYKTIGASLAKTGALVMVEQAPAGMCVGPHVCFQCQRRFFDDLDGPVEIVSGLDVPNPVSKRLEAAVLPSLGSVKEAVARAARRRL